VKSLRLLPGSSLKRTLVKANQTRPSGRRTSCAAPIPWVHIPAIRERNMSVVGQMTIWRWDVICDPLYVSAMHCRGSSPPTLSAALAGRPRILNRPIDVVIRRPWKVEGARCLQMVHDSFQLSAQSWIDGILSHIRKESHLKTLFATVNICLSKWIE